VKVTWIETALKQPAASVYYYGSLLSIRYMHFTLADVFYYY